MSFFKEFKEFAIKGNVMDLAIGVIIGGAFGRIVTSLVNDIIMPLTSVITGKLNFSERVLTLPANDVDGETIKLYYGQFITNVIDFFIVSLVIFIAIRWINRLKPKTAPAAPTTKDCPYCRSTIHIDAVKCPNCTADLKSDTADLKGDTDNL